MGNKKTTSFHWIWLMFSVFMLSLILGACARQSAQITLVVPVIETAGYEQYDLKNCETPLADIHEPVTKNFSAKQDVTIADQSVSLTTSVPYQISGPEKENLITLVKEAYQQKYMAAMAELEKQEFFVPRDRAAMFNILWHTHVYKSTLIYDFNGEAYRVEYQYTLTIPEIRQRTLAICGG